MATREDLPEILIAERGAVRTRDILPLTGVRVDQPAGSDWLFADELLRTATLALTDRLAAFHAEHPLAVGQDIAAARAAVLDAVRIGDESLADELLGAMQADGAIKRDDATVRLPAHEPRAAERGQFEALVEAIGTNPPALRDLVALGFSRDVIDAAVTAGVLVRVSPDYVMTADFVARAKMLLEDEAQQGITVSTFRERMNTSRKYAIPLLEYFDTKGVTRREGDLRIVRPGHPGEGPRS
jgi:selenocysteine-specific elongation factor